MQLRVDSHYYHMVLPHSDVFNVVLRHLIFPGEGVTGYPLFFCMSHHFKLEQLGNLVVDLLDVLSKKAVSTGTPYPNLTFVVNRSAICGIACHHLGMHLLSPLIQIYNLFKFYYLIKLYHI